MKIIDGKKLREEILTKVRTEVTELSFVPVFCDVLVGDDPASVQYVKMKATTATSIGIKFHNASFPESITTQELIEQIKLLNQIPNMCGIIIQLPLPVHLDRQAVLDAIDPDLDVDCLGTTRSNKFYNGERDIDFPTAVACMEILDSMNIDLKDKNITVLGQGSLVGKPVTALLKLRGLYPNIVTGSTENKEEIIKKSDVIISGIGQGKYIKGDMVKEGVVLIDAGTSESIERSSTGELNAGIVGDVDLESIKNIASVVSPVPGGVGPVTVAILLQNVLQVAKNKQR